MPTHVSKTKLIAAFAAIYVIWGSTYLGIKYALESIPPFMIGATRFLVAGALLFAWASLRSGGATTVKQWRHAFLLGLFLLGAGNGCVVWAMQRIPSGITALIVAIVPLLVVIIEAVRPHGKRPSRAAWIGVIVGFAGMGLLIGPSAFLGAGDVDPLAAFVLLVGSISWSAATVFGKRAAVPSAPLLASAMQLITGGICLALLSVLSGELGRVDLQNLSLKSTLAMSYLVVFGSVVAYSAYSWLLRVAQPAKISTYAYVNPVVAMLLGWGFAGEKMSGRVLIAAVIVLAGVVLITRQNAGSSA
jgi:drug/metabolite transporter (DMT)-like permease